ncbi:MAG: MarR family transcriptional regulator, partial [Bacteroidota bacterium]|nr:MarR family transcriptional regulator [Bacteroidota bacterium]
ATRLVDKLLEIDLVARCQCTANRRKIDITITEVGLALLKQIEEKIPPFEELFPAITPEEATILGQLLDKARE